MATEVEAQRALDEIERRRLEVVDEIGLPAWYWWGLALGWVVVGVLVDLDIAWVTAAATLAFGTVHAAVAHRAIGGRQRTTRLSVRADVVGDHVPALVIGAVVGLGVLTVVVGTLLSVDGAGHPVTAAGVLAAVLILLGGPRLVAALRHRAARRTPAA